MGVYSDYNKVLKEEVELQSLNEAYYGMTPDMQVALDKLSKFRNKFMYSKDNSIVVNFYKQSDVNTNKYLIEFNRQIEKIFGFNTFSLQIVNSSIQNAITYPCLIRSSLPLTKKDLVKTKNGIAYKKETKVVGFIQIYSGLIFNPDITDKGILGIILHEIGHNFSTFQSITVTVSNEITRIWKPLIFVKDLIRLHLRDAAILYNGTTEAYLSILEDIYTTPGFKHLYDAFKTFKNFLSDAKSNISKIQDKVSGIMNPIGIVSSLVKYIAHKITENTSSLLDPLFLISGWKNEKIADSFATMYGCGPDMMDALDKMQMNPLGPGRSDSVYSNIPILAAVTDIFYTIPMKTITCIFDAHPETVARAKNELRYIKVELNKQNIDPKLKRELLSQEKELEEVLDKMTSYDGADPRVIRRLWNGILLKCFDGDVRQGIANIFDDDDKYNKKYDNLVDSL